MMMELNNTLLDAGLTPEEVAYTKKCVNSGDSLEFYDSTSFEKLFEYFTFATAEMPYGIAKARTGDPDVWILDRLHILATAYSAPVSQR